MARGRAKPRGRKINPTYFIFCEGETEEAYIKFLRSFFRISSIHIHSRVAGNKITASYIQNYKKDKPEHEKDKTYLMYDADLPKVIQRLKKIKNCELLLSNPCIELWFFLHYKNHKSHADCRYFIDELTKKNKGYHKGLIDQKLTARLEQKMTVASSRAKELEHSDIKNPSTTIFAFIEKLLELTLSK